MSTHPSDPEIRPLSADEIDAAAGGAIHIHVKGLFHLALGEGHASIGVLGYGVGIDSSEGGFTFEFD